MGGLQKCVRPKWDRWRPDGEREKNKSRRREGGRRERAHKAKGDREGKSGRPRRTALTGGSVRPDGWRTEGGK